MVLIVLFRANNLDGSSAWSFASQSITLSSPAQNASYIGIIAGVIIGILACCCIIICCPILILIIIAEFTGSLSGLFASLFGKGSVTVVNSTPQQNPVVVQQ